MVLQRVLWIRVTHGKVFRLFLSVVVCNRTRSGKLYCESESLDFGQLFLSVVVCNRTRSGKLYCESESLHFGQPQFLLCSHLRRFPPTTYREGWGVGGGGRLRERAWRERGRDFFNLFFICGPLQSHARTRRGRAGERGGGTQRETHRQTDRGQTHAHTEARSDKERQTDNERVKERQTETRRETKRDRQRLGETGRDTQRDRETDREKEGMYTFMESCMRTALVFIYLGRALKA